MVRSVGVQHSYTRCVSVCGLGMEVLEVELWSSRACVGVSRRGSRSGQWVARGAAEGLATGSSFFHDSLATGGKGGTLHEGPKRTDLQTFWWASRARKEKKMLSARGFQMSAMLMESGILPLQQCSQSPRTISPGTWGIHHAGAGDLDGLPLEYLAGSLAAQLSLSPA